MALVDINWNPSKKDLRIFAGLLIAFVMVIGGSMYLRGHHGLIILTILGVLATIGLLGVVLPTLIRPVYVIWMAVAFPIGWTVSHLMMAIVFYLVITPIGIIMRVCGRDPMERRFDRSTKSYWIQRTSSQDIKQYFRQF